MVKIQLSGNSDECNMFISELCGNFMVKAVRGPVNSIKPDEVVYSIDIRTDVDADEAPISEAILGPVIKRIKMKDEARQALLAERYGYDF